jgi:uncharacterized cupredoxin-like copper-binding protein
MRKETKRAAAVAAVCAVALGGAAIGGVVARAQVTVSTVTVTMKEYKLTPSTKKVAAGRVTFVAVNKGRIPHALAIAGPGLKTKKSAMIAAGKSARLTVTLKGGSYALWCPVGNHASPGMKSTLKATGGAATAGAGAGAGTSGGAPASTTPPPGGSDGGEWG